MLQVLDESISRMGCRLLRKWVALPLLSRQRIEARLDTVGYLIEREATGAEIASLLRQIGDIERLLARVPAGKINPRELKQLKRALDAIAPLKTLLLECDNEGLIRKGEGLNPCTSLKEKLEKELDRKCDRFLGP